MHTNTQCFSHPSSPPPRHTHFPLSVLRAGGGGLKSKPFTCSPCPCHQPRSARRCGLVFSHTPFPTPCLVGRDPANSGSAACNPLLVISAAPAALAPWRACEVPLTSVSVFLDSGLTQASLSASSPLGNFVRVRDRAASRRLLLPVRAGRSSRLLERDCSTERAV